MIFADATDTVGRTPLVELGRIGKGLPGRVVAKLEMRNPCGSVKDRVGVALIESAERQGILRPGMRLVEATGGNTGIGLAFAAATRGYPLISVPARTMPTRYAGRMGSLPPASAMPPSANMSTSRNLISASLTRPPVVRMTKRTSRGAIGSTTIIATTKKSR